MLFYFHILLASQPPPPPPNLDEGLYAVAGYDGTNLVETHVFLLGSSSTEETDDKLSVGRSALGSAYFDERIYAVGGRDSASNALATVQKYDGYSWSDSASMNVARKDVAVAAFSGGLYAAGGQGTTVSSSSALRTMEKFDGTSWASTSSMLTARVNFGLAPFGTDLYAVRHPLDPHHPWARPCCDGQAGGYMHALGPSLTLNSTQAPRLWP